MRISNEKLKKVQHQSVPFQVADRHEAALVNSYFHILIKYGDQYETLGFNDLIEVQATPSGDVDVRLRNLEYDLTRSIKKVVYGFQSIEGLFASGLEKAELLVYVTPKSLPESYKGAPERIEKVGQDLTKESGGKFSVQVIEPTKAQQEEIFEKFGIQPFGASLFSNDFFYLHMLLKIGNKHLPVVPAAEMTESDIREAIIAALKRSAPGFLKTVGLVLPSSPESGAPGAQNPEQSFQALSEKLAENYSVEPVTLADGVPTAIDVLLIAAPEDLQKPAVEALDEFIMRGGAVVLLAGRIKPTFGRGDISVSQISTGLESLLRHHGVQIGEQLVLDSRSDAFPVPIRRNLGGFAVQDIQLIPYPFFVDIGPDAMAEGNLAMQGLPGLTLHWPSPITLVSQDPTPKPAQTKSEHLTTEVLLRSSPDSWLQTDTNVIPDFERFAERGFGKPSELPPSSEGAQVLAVSLTGSFTSLFAQEAKQRSDKAKPDDASAPQRAEIKRSPPDTRMAIVASANFIEDHLLSMSRQTGSDKFVSNLRFVENLVDWAVADVDLLSIRSRGAYTRSLHVQSDARQMWEWLNYGLAVVLFALVLLGATRWRTIKPLTLEKPPTSNNDTGRAAA
ncbi:MAG: Gldg family protein [Myxococcota bacterium]